jgi:hypothetical protein
MGDEKLSEGSAVECYNTQDMVPESRISLRNTFAAMQFLNYASGSLDSSFSSLGRGCR